MYWTIMYMQKKHTYPKAESSEFSQNACLLGNNTQIKKQHSSPFPILDHANKNVASRFQHHRLISHISHRMQILSCSVCSSGDRVLNLTLCVHDFCINFHGYIIFYFMTIP